MSSTESAMVRAAITSETTNGARRQKTIGSAEAISSDTVDDIVVLRAGRRGTGSRSRPAMIAATISEANDASPIPRSRSIAVSLLPPGR